MSNIRIPEIPPKNDHGRRVVIVIDDDEISRSLAARALKSEFEVFTFESPIEALRRAEVEFPYLIMLDVHMPNIDGYEVLRLFRSHPATSSTPIICMSIR